MKVYKSMGSPQEETDINALKKTILAWLELRLEEQNYQWISNKSKCLENDFEDWEFFSSFSLVPRYTGKLPLNLSNKEKQQAEKLRAGWKPDYWTQEELGRALLVLSIAGAEKENFLEKLEKVLISSDTGEAIALYKSLVILPYPADLQRWAAEGIRSNMTTVFNAVALRNLYPADYMEESAWNQMVLKALFVGSPLYLIQNIDKRANQKLANMLVDYAHERWAAERSVSPELWRPVGPFIDKTKLPDMQKVLSCSEKIKKQAALLALMDSSLNEAQGLIKNHKKLKKEIVQNSITWNDIGERFDN